MPNVATVEVKDWAKDDGTVVKVTNVAFADGSQAPGYDLPPGIEVGKPLPEGWEIATSKAGKPYIKVPKPGGKGGFGGGPAAFRNTREGFLLEQDSIHRSVALQQAIAIHIATIQTGIALSDPLKDANDMYDWLRKPAGAGARPAQTPESASPGNGPVGRPALAVSPAEPDTAGRQAGTSQDHTQANVGKQPPVSSGGQGVLGKVAPKPSGACEHTNATGFKPPDFTDPLPKGFLYCPDCVSTFKGGKK